MAIFGSNRAIALPFGAAAVAAPMAAIMGLAGLLVPTAWIESASFQLYLDALIPSAVPPFGAMAHGFAALLLAIFGAAIGWILAKIFGVVSNTMSLRGLLQRMRGEGAEDEVDAPPLRAEDRHPDAPARRPFSVSQDVRTSESALPDLPPLPPLDDAGLRVEAATMPDAAEDAPLILDSAFADDAAEEEEPLILSDMVTEQADEPAPIEPVAVEATTDVTADALLATEVPPEAPEVTPEAPEEAVWQAPELPPAPPVAADPIDVSVMRLDQLLARLEQGLARRQPAPAVAATAEGPAMLGAPEVANDVDVAVEPAEAAAPAADNALDGAPVPPPAGEMPVPDDPALAAALATLRRMRAHVG